MNHKEDIGWKPLNQTSGANHLKRFSSAYTGVLHGVLDGMKRNAMLMAQMGRELANRYTEIDPSVAKKSTEAGQKALDWKAQGSRTIETKDLPPHIRAAIEK